MGGKWRKRNEKKLWCVSKKAYMMEDPYSGNVIDTISFGKCVTHTAFEKNIENGMIRVSNWKQINASDKKVSIKGWVNPHGFADKRVINYARLYFTNNTGKRVPVSLRYKGKANGFIPPGETVQMLAKCGDWCLTNKGWTLFKWFDKNRDVYDWQCIDLVYLGVLATAASDFRSCVRRIKRGKFKSDEAANETFKVISEVINWFRGTGYKSMFDAVPGDERLQDLLDEQEITLDWIRQKQSEFCTKVRGYKI